MSKSQAVSQGRKFSQVIRGATAIFLRDGYAGASVDDIARAANVSKATLYSYFPDKSRMFQEAMRAEADRLDGGFTLDIPDDLHPRQAIPLMTARIAEWLADPDRVRLYRIHVAEARRFAALSANFHDRVLHIVHDAIRPYLVRWVQSGQLCIEDTRIAAEQLIALASAGLMDALLRDRQNFPSNSDIQAISQSAAHLFLKAALPAPAELLLSAGSR
ncbi:TetR family transcriptional regulator [Paracoccus acridae]|uniref:TetR family transcriptional regulator n=1 Tax=Paracoccus acridae TaxID=1795310 RepID=A0ABQ1VDS7_9RHOB|nr:TetR/AcrR family transcriptional regulator [Paracoccus acridae]GGF55207.1 TetR family transcriptional regulator [Paracoccus acridae]